MFTYRAKNNETFESISRAFPTEAEAEIFAENNKEKFPQFTITSSFIDGIILESGLLSNGEEFDEEKELRAMGLKNDEGEGFDWTQEEKG